MSEKADVLFIGSGASAVCWYRCALPAMFMGADWVGIVGAPPSMQFVTGLVGNSTVAPDINQYKVVVVQQPSGLKWLTAIKELQARGIVVLYEVDDYLHGIRKKRDHDFKDKFGKDYLKQAEMCMRVCDGMIVSTDYIARRYATFNRNIFVCPNGLDVARYDLTIPQRGMIGDKRAVDVGWAGATGHSLHVAPWLRALSRIMRDEAHVNFISIGQPLASQFKQVFGYHRAISTPFTLIEQYPSAMTMFDIALAPAGQDSFSRGKSDLRWLEASALGIPVIADPVLYPQIEHGVTGFHATTPGEAEDLMRLLIEDADLRRTVGTAAKDFVRANRSMDVAVRRWCEVLESVVH